MALQYDYQGEAPTPPAKDSGGQSYKKTRATSTEQSQAIGGIKDAEIEVNESEEKPVTYQSPIMEVGS
jgi:hypothetical protein